MHYTLLNVPGYPTEPYVFTGWSSYSFTLEATSNSTRLQFFDEGFQIGGDPTNGNASPLLDNVAVIQLPVPEPSSIALLGIGALGLMFAGRKRRQNKLTA